MEPAKATYWKTLTYLPFALGRRFGPVRMRGDMPEVLIISPGGVATTTLILQVARFRRVNASDDSDGLKHLPRPPRRAQAGDLRHVFVTGPQEDIVRSIARRHWLEAQSANLGSPLGVVLRGRWQRAAFAAAVRRQYRNWTRAGLQHLLVLDYEKIWESAEQLAAFLGITEPEFLTSFPRRRDRALPERAISAASAGKAAVPRAAGKG
jgi:hypothetical protein